MYTYQVTEQARRDQERNATIVNKAADVLGIDEQDLWEAAKNSYEPTVHGSPARLLNNLQREFGGRFHNMALYHDDIPENDLIDFFSPEDVEDLVESGYLEKLDHDEDLLEIINEAFEKWGMIFTTHGDYWAQVMRELPEEVKKKILKEYDKADDDRDYPSFLRIREIILVHLDVVSSRKVMIKEQ